MTDKPACRTMPGRVRHVKIQDPEGEMFDGYIVLAHYEGHLSYVQVFSAKSGTVVHGLLNALSENINMHLDAGMPVPELVEMLEDQTFSPKGETDDPDVPRCTSVPNYIGQRIRLDYMRVNNEAAPAL